MSGVNPQGCQVSRSSSPRPRNSTTTSCGATPVLPDRGRIGIFNRSYYEEVLVVRVHEKYSSGRTAAVACGQALLERAVRRHRPFRGLSQPARRGDAQILPEPLHKEQKKRFMERLDTRRNTGSSPPPMCTSASSGATTCRRSRKRSAPRRRTAPWYVVPADNKWFTRLVVAAAIVEVVEKLDLAYPKVARRR